MLFRSLILSYFAIQAAILYFKNFMLSRHLDGFGCDLLIGLTIFSLSNLLTFISASQLYSDPFVLILIGLCLGSFLAIPCIYFQYSNAKNNQNSVESLNA